MLLNTVVIVKAEEKEIVSDIKLTDNVLSVSGTISGKNKDVDLFLLNPGKTVSDLNFAVNKEMFDAAVNYCNVVKSDDKGNYSDQFKVKDMQKDTQYLLYVKSDSESYTKYVAKSHCIYVSKNGNDTSGNGTKDKPFATISKAKNYIRTIKKSAPIEVIIGGGVYNVSETISFEANDSGTEDFPITYKAADGEKVVLEGTSKLDISKLTAVTDKDILPRLQTGIADKLVEIDLAEQGIPKNVVDFMAKHSVANCGKAMGIYLNDNIQSIARWPNVGYETILDVTVKGGAVSDKTTELGGAVFKINGLDSERAKRWEGQTDMYVEGYMSNDWHIEWSKVESVNPDDLTVKLAGYTHYGVNKGMRVAAVNLPEEIDIPGEWYADVKSMKLYYYPPYELTEKDKLEIATLCNNFITVRNASYINFEGIEFSKNADSPLYASSHDLGGNAVALINTSNIDIKKCIMGNIGMDGIVVKNSENVDIDGCTIYNTGFGGIYVTAGDRVSLKPCNVKISNCMISDINRDTGNNSIAGIRIYGVGTVVENNLFFNIPNSAIRYAGNNHIIRNNEIFDCVNRTADAGAIYAGRSWTSYGTVIKNNYFHDIGGGVDTSYFASAVFWDDNHSGNTFIGNLVEMNNYVKSSGVEIGGGRDNVVESNILVNAEYAIDGSDRSVNPPKEYDPNDETNFYNQTAFQSFKEAADNVTNAYYITDSDWLEPYMYGYPTIMENFKELMYDKKYSRIETIRNNVTYNCSQTAIDLGVRMRADSTVENNVSAVKEDFVNADNGDYRLISSAREKYGLPNDVWDETFDMNQIGLRDGYTIESDITSFDLVYPANNSNIGGNSTVLKWNKSPFADTYAYEVSTDSDFNSIVAKGETAYNIAEIDGLEVGKDYYWRVTANNESRRFGGDYLCNKVFRFTTSGELLFENFVYDKMMGAVSFNVTNTQSESDSFTIITATKDNSGKLISLRSTERTILPKESKSFSVSSYFSNDTDASFIELYIWDSLGGMRNLTEKKQFKK